MGLRSCRFSSPPAAAARLRPDTVHDQNRITIQPDTAIPTRPADHFTVPAARQLCHQLEQPGGRRGDLDSQCRTFTVVPAAWRWNDAGHAHGAVTRHGAARHREPQVAARYGGERHRHYPHWHAGRQLLAAICSAAMASSRHDLAGGIPLPGRGGASRSSRATSASSLARGAPRSSWPARSSYPTRPAASMHASASWRTPPTRPPSSRSPTSPPARSGAPPS